MKIYFSLRKFTFLCVEQFDEKPIWSKKKRKEENDIGLPSIAQPTQFSNRAYIYQMKQILLHILDHFQCS